MIPRILILRSKEIKYEEEDDDCDEDVGDDDEDNGNGYDNDDGNGNGNEEEVKNGLLWKTEFLLKIGKTWVFSMFKHK